MSVINIFISRVYFFKEHLIPLFGSFFIGLLTFFIGQIYWKLFFVIRILHLRITVFPWKSTQSYFLILGRTGPYVPNHYHHHHHHHHHHHILHRHHHHLHPHQEGEQGPVCAKPGYHEVVHKHPRGQVNKINFNENVLDSINVLMW